MTLVTTDYSIAIFTSVRGKQNIQANLIESYKSLHCKTNPYLKNIA